MPVYPGALRVARNLGIGEGMAQLITIAFDMPTFGTDSAAQVAKHVAPRPDHEFLFLSLLVLAHFHRLNRERSHQSLIVITSTPVTYPSGKKLRVPPGIDEPKTNGLIFPTLPVREASRFIFRKIPSIMLLYRKFQPFCGFREIAVSRWPHWSHLPLDVSGEKCTKFPTISVAPGARMAQLRSTFRTGKIFFLNATASLILNRLEQLHTKSQIIREICERYKAPTEQVRADVDELLNELQRHGLVHGAGAEETR